jgi:uncharacterized membrane protein
MAGIGFRLQKILENDTYAATIKAHAFSALISAGPWIMSVMTLSALTVFRPAGMPPEELTLFKSIIIYCFAMSLVVTGFFHYPFTRYLADRLFGREEESVLPVFNTAAVLVLATQALVAVAFFMSTGLTPALKFLSVMTAVTLALVWIVMIFLTTLKDYGAIVWCYFAGSVASVILSIFLGGRAGLAGYLAGYWAGQLLTAFLWMGRLHIEFSSERLFEWESARYLQKHFKLALVGLFYNMGVWADKAMFWFSPRGEEIVPGLRIFTMYDSASFFAYLTVIPALSVFMIKVETDFYIEYRRYFERILQKEPYSAIQKAREGMAQALRTSITALLGIQGTVTTLAVLFAVPCAAILRMPPEIVPIFKVLCLGSFLNAAYLIVCVLILYFDFQGTALIASVIFFAGNTLFTAMTVPAGEMYYGFGYTAGCWLALLAAYFLLDRRLARLEYHTFTSQRVGGPKDETLV